MSIGAMTESLRSGGWTEQSVGQLSNCAKKDGSKMGSWVFMFVMLLFIPLAMIGFGHLFLKRASKKINYFYGYRTTMSMKNRDTWEFAHRYAGKIWWVTGWITLLVTVVFMLLLWGADDHTIGWYGGLFCLAQITPLLHGIYPTEKALRKTFDKDGNRKN